YTKALGEAYSRLRGRHFGSVRLERAGQVEHVSLWKVISDQGGSAWESPPSSPPQNPSSGDVGDPGDLHSPTRSNNTSTRAHTRACDKPGESVSGEEVSEGPRGPLVPDEGIGYDHAHGELDANQAGGLPRSGEHRGRDEDPPGTGGNLRDPGPVPAVPDSGGEPGSDSGLDTGLHSGADQGG